MDTEVLTMAPSGTPANHRKLLMQLKRMQPSLNVIANSEAFTMFLTIISVYTDKSLLSPTVTYDYTFLSQFFSAHF